MTDGQNDKKFSTWNPEAKCMVCTWLKNSDSAVIFSTIVLIIVRLKHNFSYSWAEIYKIPIHMGESRGDQSANNIKGFCPLFDDRPTAPQYVAPNNPKFWIRLCHSG